MITLKYSDDFPFKEKIIGGYKRQSIRSDNSSRAIASLGNHDVGTTIKHRTGKKDSDIFMTTVCRGVDRIIIEPRGRVLVGKPATTPRLLSLAEKEALARADGFASFKEFYDFFEERYPLPLIGKIIYW